MTTSTTRLRRALIGAVTLALGVGALASGVASASTPNGTYTFAPRLAAQLASTANKLGKAKLVEATAGSYFPAGATTDVRLTLSAGTYTPALTPVITVPSDYTVTTPATTASGIYTFTVTAPAVTVKATVLVAGLQLDAPAAPAQVVTIDASVGAGPSEGAAAAANVLDFKARTGGATRYDTAAALFNEGAFTDRTGAVLSSGETFPDALSANYLAGQLGTGTLLTTASTLAPAARKAIVDNNVTTVYITGGTGAVSQAVQDQLAATHVGDNPQNPLISVERIFGHDRYDTNKAVNEYRFTARDTVLLASGNGFADALALGPVAYKESFPLILTGGTTLGATENAQLSDFNPTNVVIAGGTGVVSQGIQDDLTSRGYTVTRLAGTDRTLTATQVALWATVTKAPAFGFNSNTAYITTGALFADALAAGPVAGAAGAVIMLSNSATVTGAGIPAYFATKSVGSAGDGTTVDTLHALGLNGATDNSMMKAAAATIGQ